MLLPSLPVIESLLAVPYQSVRWANEVILASSQSMIAEGARVENDRDIARSNGRVVPIAKGAGEWKNAGRRSPTSLGVQ